MKTLTLTLSDEAAAKLTEHAAENGKSAEEWAARVVEGAYAADWLDDLPPEDRAAIEEGLAQADRGEFAADAEVEEVYSRFGR
jgi:predicted transcriptional regulator